MAKNKEIKIEMPTPAYFKKDCLTFPSGHHLVLSDRHYRCELDCNGKCSLHEPQINAENMERNFEYFALKFKLPSIDAPRFARRLVKDLFIRIINDDDDEMDTAVQDEIQESTLDVMKRDLRDGKKVEESDVQMFADSVIAENTMDWPLLLHSITAGIIKDFSEPENQAFLGRELSVITKHVNISYDGKIESIELEEWGWYILNFINRKFPNYLPNLKNQGVKIINNAKDDWLSLDPETASRRFDEESFKTILNSYSAGPYHEMAKNLKFMIKTGLNDPSERQKEKIMDVFGRMMSPDVILKMKLLQLSNAKVVKTRANKRPDEKYIEPDGFV